MGWFNSKKTVNNTSVTNVTEEHTTVNNVTEEFNQQTSGVINDNHEYYADNAHGLSGIVVGSNGLFEQDVMQGSVVVRDVGEGATLTLTDAGAVDKAMGFVAEFAEYNLETLEGVVKDAIDMLTEDQRGGAENLLVQYKVPVTVIALVVGGYLIFGKKKRKK